MEVFVHGEGIPRHVSIQMRKFRQRQRYRAGDEWKISKRRLLALPPCFLERAARRLDAREIDLDGLHHMSAGGFGAHHAPGDAFPQWADWHDLGNSARRRGQGSSVLKMRQHLLALDA